MSYSAVAGDYLYNPATGQYMYREPTPLFDPFDQARESYYDYGTGERVIVDSFDDISNERDNDHLERIERILKDPFDL